MSIFAPTDLFEVQIKYVVIKSKGGIAAVRVIDDSTDKGKEEIEKLGDKVETLSTSWIVPNWKQSNDVLRQAMRFDDQAGWKSS
jgi:hypothetical protein